MTITTKKAAELLGIIPRRVQALCKQGRIIGATLRPTARGPVWMIRLRPDGTIGVRPGSRGPRMRHGG